MSETDSALVLVFGSVAVSWEQVASFLTGDAHDRSKVQVLVDGKFYSLTLEQDNRTEAEKHEDYWTDRNLPPDYDTIPYDEHDWRL